MYCNSHVPKSGPGHFDQNSVGIRQALNAPKSNKFVNEQIRGGSRDIDGKSKIKIQLKFRLIHNGSLVLRQSKNINEKKIKRKTNYFLKESHCMDININL